LEDIFSLGELFKQVQLQNVFPDGKTFVDCTPRTPLLIIQQQYELKKDEPGFDLRSFVNKHFSAPENYSQTIMSNSDRPLASHVEMLWNELTRQPVDEKSSLIKLPKPYIVPGGRFREIYYWDSYFTMLGLQVSGKYDMIENMVDNFSFLIEKFGYIPNGNRTYFLGRSQPPFYAAMVNLLSEVNGKEILIKYLPQLEKEYNFWMRGFEKLNSECTSTDRVSLMPDGSILNHYWDEFDAPRPESYKEDFELAKHNDGNSVRDKNLYRNLRAACESGWDFSSRWYKIENEFNSIHTTEIIPVDLNCLLYNLEQTIAEAYRLSNDEISFNKYQRAAYQRKKAIDKYCWNNEEKFYFDYDYISQKQKKSVTLAATFPLFFNIASQKQSDEVSNILQDKFLCAGGLKTTIFVTGQQWDAPNGWAPLQWIAIKGLRNYGHNTLATEIAERWMKINEKVYKDMGKMMEKYNVMDVKVKAGGGEYPSQDGFGWTNGVYLALKSLRNA